MDTYQKITAIDKQATTVKVKIGTVFIEEKIDGSQFRTYVHKGERQFGSHTQSPPDGMFAAGVENMNRILDTVEIEKPTMIFAEYLKKPKHNTLAYDRVPRDNLIVFDIKIGNEWLRPNDKKALCDDLGLECVPLLAEIDGSKLTIDYLESLLATQSVLGGQNVEGVVIKNYDQVYEQEPFFGMPIFVKYVSTRFKELNDSNWKLERSRKGFIQSIVDRLRSEARWDKAIQHLTEQGKLKGQMQDIPLIINEIAEDTYVEEGESVMHEIWQHIWRNEIKGGLVRGVPEWYRAKLQSELFGDKTGISESKE